MLEIVFSSFWTWLGSVILVSSIGYTAALPFFWYVRAMQERRLAEEQNKIYKFYDQRN